MIFFYIALSIVIALKVDRESKGKSIAIASKSEQERQLCLQNIKRAITIWEAIKKRPVLLQQYCKILIFNQIIHFDELYVIDFNLNDCRRVETREEEKWTSWIKGRIRGG